MNQTTHQEDQSTLTEEAARWHARLRSGVALSAAEEVRFKTWCMSPEHQRAYDDMETLWNELALIADSPEVMAERTSSEAAELQADRAIAVDAVAAPVQKSRMRVALPWAMAASVVLAILVGTTLVLRPVPEASPVAFATHVGEQRRVALEDGSSVMLNTASEISVKYTNGQRSLTLLKGQATFEVAKDASRPFVVRVGQGTVTALGTVFDVYKHDDRVTVTLLEGRVAVLPKADSSGDSGSALVSDPQAAAGGVPGAAGTATAIVLTAGQQVSYAEGNSLPTRIEADVKRALAWRQKKMDFQDTLLPEAIAEANRYSNVKIELHAPGLENARMSGVFDTDGKGFVEGVQAYFGLKAQHVGSDRIVLTNEP
jgi:transmembrane sensor